MDDEDTAELNSTLGALAEEVAGLRRAVEAGVELQKLQYQHWSYGRTQELGPNALAAMRSSIENYLTPDQRGQLDEVSDSDMLKLLVAERVYTHQFGLFASERAAGQIPASQESLGLETWVVESSQGLEWQLIHLRQGSFYRDFARQANRWIVSEVGRILASRDSQEESLAAAEVLQAARARRKMAIQQEARNWWAEQTSDSPSSDKAARLGEIFGADHVAKGLVDEDAFVGMLAQHSDFLLRFLSDGETS